ncbi:MAG: glutamyl-tRNA amidotransferase [Clostridiales bacterium]|nr:glutamyl-tRNA amidotransferase [Clostridiales bacterium]
MMRKVMKTETNISMVRKELKITQYILTVIALLLSFATPVFADDPLAAINGLSDFIFSAIKAIGMILLGFGIVQIGLSLKSHDAQQRANGFLTFFGGIVIAFAKDILDMII